MNSSSGNQCFVFKKKVKSVQKFRTFTIKVTQSGETCHKKLEIMRLSLKLFAGHSGGRYSISNKGHNSIFFSESDNPLIVIYWLTKFQGCLQLL